MHKQCKGCYYNRQLSACLSYGNACHYLLYTNNRRKIAEDGKCLSKKVEEKKKKC